MSHSSIYSIPAPKSILEEESSKKPCSWFQTASCQYGQLCRFSHYTPDQLGYLQQQVNQMEYNEWLNKQPKQYSQHMIDDFMAKRNRFKQGEVTKALRTFWKHPNDLLKKVKDVPPSLQLIEPSLMPETLDTWG